MARSLMVQGTASHVGKSWLVAGLCRLLRQDGWRVAPFKSQNMSNNAAALPGGGEIGRAQALQALACGITPTADMNPVLLKPTSDRGSQVILLGHPVGVFSAAEYYADVRPRAWAAIQAAYHRLAAEYDAVILEGAGSPAEVNLHDRDIANMRVAELADAPVILVADIDRGGVFAAVVGTLELLPQGERNRVKGIVINRFRGDPDLFTDGVRFLQERTGVPVLGVLPYLDLRLPEEDGVAVETSLRGVADGHVDIVVVAVPRISNFTDFDALARTPDVAVRFVREPADLGQPDAIILPGSKNTLADLAWLRSRGWDAALRRVETIVGLCGGFQMLGERVDDPLGVEDGSPRSAPGLGRLDAVTTFSPSKRALPAVATELATGERLHGYEIHAGQTRLGPGAQPWLDGVGSAAQSGVLATYLHGLFDNDGFRLRWVNGLRTRKGLPPLADAGPGPVAVQSALDELAAAIRRHLDIDRIYHMLEEGAAPARRTP
ncbi:MAG TPA: cobyric acid synthase [Bacillota bacterium]|nr:cobyric acid synthase [Bacillota bacterium]